MQIARLSLNLFVLFMVGAECMPISGGSYTEGDIVHMRLDGKDERAISQALGLKAASPSYKLATDEESGPILAHLPSINPSTSHEDGPQFAMVPHQEAERKKQSHQGHEGCMHRLLQLLRRPSEDSPIDEIPINPRDRGLRPRYLEY